MTNETSMSNDVDEFLAGLERRVVDAARADNRRRRRRRGTRVGVPVAAALVAGAVAFGVVPGGGSMNRALVPVARAAGVATPNWSHMTMWEYSTTITVDHILGKMTGSYELEQQRRLGNHIVSDGRVADYNEVANSQAQLGHTLEEIESGGLPTHTITSSSDDDPFPTAELPSGQLPTTVAGWQQIIDKENYGSTCGEKAMVVASDVLQVPGVGPTARGSLIEALGHCSGIQVDNHATDPLGRSGIAISATGNGSGQESTATLTLNPQSGMPLSLVRTNDDPVNTRYLNVTAGTIIDAKVFEYNE